MAQSASAANREHCTGPPIPERIQLLWLKHLGNQVTTTDSGMRIISEVFSPDAFVEGEDDQGCGGDRGDGSGIEGDVLEGLEVLDQGVGPLGGSPH